MLLANSASDLRSRASMRKAEVKISELLKLVQHDYIDNAKKSKATLDVHIEKHLLPALGERSAERLRVADVEAYKTHRKQEGAKNATINLELAALRRAFSLGMATEIISHTPTIRLFQVGNTNRRQGFFEAEEYTKQLAALPPWLKQVFRFGYWSGWREGEILGLTWAANYDEPGHCIRLLDSKSGRGRVLPLVDQHGGWSECGKVIQEQLQNRVVGCERVFHRQGKPIHRSTFQKAWRRGCEASGVNRHFHDLRRTAVRNLTRAGVPRTIAKAITGHESDHIFERYDIVDTLDMKRGLAAMADYVNSTTTRAEETAAPGSRGETHTKTPELAERAGFEPASGSPHYTISSLPRARNRLVSLIKSFISLANKPEEHDNP